jgi:hypothetical protein
MFGGAGNSVANLIVLRSFDVDARDERLLERGEEDD